MVGPFGLIRTPRIHFGAGEVRKLPGLLKYQGRQILIITGSNSFLQNKGIAGLLSSLEQEKFTLYIERVGHEPSPEDVDRITIRYRYSDVQTVVSIGGGSVIDAGKAVSAMLPLEHPVMDYLEGVGTKAHPGLKKFFVAIPTTSGTGSETTANAVLSGSNARGGFKRSLRHENLVPDIALVDPVLMISCPRQITAASGMDAFTQLIESYLSLKSNPFTDSLALDGIRRIHRHLAEACRNGDNLEAREGMAYAAMLSGLTLANAGLGLIHGFASSVGASFDIPHGVICGTMMGIVNRFNIKAILQNEKHGKSAEKYVCLGRILSDRENMENEWYMQFVADYLDELTNNLVISKLGAYGVKPDDLEKIASITDHKSNPVVFNKEQLIEMLRIRL
jgi:alcohol dehydrogenase class IV